MNTSKVEPWHADLSGSDKSKSSSSRKPLVNQTSGGVIGVLFIYKKLNQ